MTQLPHRIGALIGQWPLALVACLVLAAAILLPCLGSSGLWEPTERQLADRLAPPLDVEPKPPPAPPRNAKDDEDCIRVPPKDAAARSLSARAVEWGRDTFGDDDSGRRLPFALLGLLAALAVVGLAMRTGGGRAGVIALCVLLAMPLMVLQSRSLTSEIGTACGAALILYALVALARPHRKHLVVDLIASTLALAIGIPIAFYGGGALLGLLVPIGAFAVAGALGVPLVVDAIKKRSVAGHVPALVATLATIAIASVLAYQMYFLTEPYPGLTPPPARQMFGQAIVAEGCWSSALGAIWRPEDDIRFIFDSSFEQIAYGTFPWGILGPIAMFALIRSGDRDNKLIGAVTLAWAAGSWLATEAFHRKVGHVTWSGFPALAVAIGVWLDDVLTRRLKKPDPGPDHGLRAGLASEPSPRAAAPSAEPAMLGGAMLIALFVALAVLDLGKDMQSFSDKLTSLLTGAEIIQYPKEAKLLLPLRLWVLVLGVLAAVGFAVTMVAWRDDNSRASQTLRKVANAALAASMAATVTLAAFWSFAWQPALSVHLSSKALLAKFDDLRSTGEPLVIMGDLGYAPAHYTSVTPEQVQTRDQIVTALKRPSRVFAIAPQGELCPLHREIGEQPYFVLEDRNTRSLLLSNRIDDPADDKNPLREMIAHKEPQGIKTRPPARIVFDNKIELIGWDLPARVERGDEFEAITYWKVIAPVGGAWTMIQHYDGPLRLRDGDHKPIKDRCPTSSWQPGDYIIDKHTMKTGGGGFPAGKYDLWVGFFMGQAPNFRNMTVSAAPGDRRDTTDRVKVGSIMLD